MPISHRGWPLAGPSVGPAAPTGTWNAPNPERSRSTVTPPRRRRIPHRDPPRQMPCIAASRHGLNVGIARGGQTNAKQTPNKRQAIQRDAGCAASRSGRDSCVSQEYEENFVRQHEVGETVLKPRRLRGCCSKDLHFGAECVNSCDLRGPMKCCVKGEFLPVHNLSTPILWSADSSQFLSQTERPAGPQSGSGPALSAVDRPTSPGRPAPTIAASHPSRSAARPVTFSARFFVRRRVARGLSARPVRRSLSPRQGRRDPGVPPAGAGRL